MNDESGLAKQVKRGVFLTIPAARALLPVIKTAVEEAETYESRRIASKRQAQPKRADDGHIADFLRQCGVRAAQPAGGSGGGAANSVGSSAERAESAERGASSLPQLAGSTDPGASASSASASTITASKFGELEGEASQAARLAKATEAGKEQLHESSCGAPEENSQSR